jgi:predicted PurR-regulated permease PerM
VDQPSQRVEVVVPVRTLLVLLAFGSLVVLTVFSIGTLLSILIAAVLALGLDPVVGALVRRGWRRGRAAVAVFVGLFVATAAIVLLTAAPLWEQIVEFAKALPGYWDNLTHTAAFENLTSTAGAYDSIRKGLKELAAGLPDAATTLLGVVGAILAVPFAAVIKILVREAGAPRRARMAALRDR